MDIDVLAHGIVAGSLYALVAVSFNILYRPTNVFNFAQGELVMLGAMIFASLTSLAGMPWLVAFAGTLVTVGCIGLVEERIAVAPILARSQTGTGWVITTLATSLIISNLVGRFWGPDPILVKPPALLSMDSLDIGSSRISSYEIALVLVTLVLVAIVERVYRTLKGKAVMAVAEDREAALLRGIDPGSLGRWSFFLGAAFAAMTGVLAAPILYASTSLGPDLLLKGFAAAAVGSIGNNRGALIAGYVIGVTEAVGAALLSPGYQEAVIFIVVLAMLLLKPEGLFGSPNARTV
ncbi:MULTISPECIES: branched-chain amino acid ABC transporter permease [unclassified Bradyrhizobium]|uniref:branched-chain amino acid ABC transporter permease n=1 Tax=unclassified Bradyrhizobium TaxID=2631580 RepID=UPI0024795DE7|nr:MULTISPECIES: branched-chain amino acid ABC transporter permease [unclassified Bradyrhizobium]WGS18827.1 branched-chain amino acid ABC transporter permease [Bradyrhizobium sp. ISRA463]WGS25655.1 branched-chain amino acid ABC transporter permease [Bradyrhizobium sp. ISRA464]